MDAVLGIAVSATTAWLTLVEGAGAEGSVIDEAVLDISAQRRPDAGAAEVVNTIIDTQRSLAGAGHRLIAAGVCALGGFASPALREAMQRRGVGDVVLIDEAEAEMALSNRTALHHPQRDVAAARGAALAAPRAVNAGPPTIFRSTPMQHGGPTQSGPIVHVGMEATRSGAIAYPRTGPFAAPTYVAPTASPPHAPAPAPLAYSMTGHLAGLTDHLPEYHSGSIDYSEAHALNEADVEAGDPDLDDHSPEQPARRSFLLAGSLAVAFVAVAIAMLSATVVFKVTPTADQKPVTSSQQPVLTPLATRVSQPPVAVPASVPPPPAPPPPPPVTARPAPPVIAHAPTVPVTQRQAPTRAPVTQAPHRGTEGSTTDDSSTPRSGHTHDGPSPDEYDNPPLDEYDSPPPRDRYTPEDPPADDRAEAPHRGGDVLPRGGILDRTPCIPLLTC